MAGRRVRLDAELVRRGLAGARAEAQRLIADGRVTVDGAPATKAAAQVAPKQAVAVLPGERAWASRAAHKLLGALDRFAIPVAGRQCLDAGASTGGFTDVLLHRGAARVVAVDVGYGQLLWRLRQDPRVVVLDRTNVRALTREQVPPPAADLVVADLSFISLTLVLPALRAVAAISADFVLMVKPQFEAGRGHVGSGGVVRDPSGWRAAMLRVADAATAEGLVVRGIGPSPLPGPSGNVEFFLWLAEGDGIDVHAAVAMAVAEGTALVAPDPGPNLGSDPGPDPGPAEGGE
jgi:23S rRNA (cytidine1920-2'-O)/16S rRNA (cytidine1409-2'-O)-methyltransferase